jgi:putative Ca2+/H+ antiporter (TMEM165/GDT1 family)
MLSIGVLRVDLRTLSSNGAIYKMKLDWHVFLSAFALVFLAEFGDKTQLATLSLLATSSSRWMVFMGAALALVSITLLSVLVSEALLKVVPAVYVKRVAGVLFILIGIASLLGK